jgi:autotransporter-associated beta strand protein
VRFPRFLGAVASAILALPALAADYAWVGGSGTWSTAASWSDNTYAAGATGIVPGAADFALFNQATVSGPQIVSLDADQAALGLLFLNAGTTGLQSDSATPRLLTLGASGLHVVSGSGAVTLGNATNVMNVGLAASQTWVNNSASPFTVLNGISLTNAGAQTLTVGGTGNTLLSGIVADGAGALALAKTGAGTLTLGGANTFTGTTNIAGGTLSIASDGAFGTAPGAATPGSIAIGTNAALATTATMTLNANRGIALAPFAGIAVAPGTTLTYGGAIAGTGGSLLLSGGGTLILTGTNTYTGGTIIAPGTTLQLGNGTVNGAIPSSGTVTNAGTLRIAVSGTPQTISAAIGGQGNIVVTNAAASGTSTFLMNGANTYTGTTTFGTAGTNNVFNVGNATALGAPFVGGRVIVNGGTSSTPTFLNLGTGTTTVTIVGKTLVLDGTGGFRTALNAGTSSGTNVWAGNIVLNSPTGFAAFYATGGGTLTVGANASNTITGSAASFAARGGSGTILLNSTFNTPTMNFGRTDSAPVTLNSPYNIFNSNTVALGNLTIGTNDTFMPTAPLSMGQSNSSTPTLSLGTNRITVASLSDSGSTPNSAQTATITGSGTGAQLVVNGTSNTSYGAGGNANASSVFTGLVALTKLGSSTLTINSRAVNSTTGTVSVNQGTLVFDNANLAAATNLWNSASALALGGGTFQITARPSTATSQSLNGLTVNAGASSIVLNNTVTGNPATLLNLGAITRPVAGGMVQFVLPLGARSATNGITTTTANANGILGGWATVANDWASVDPGTGNTISAYPSLAYTAASLGGTIASDATANVQIDGAGPGSVAPALPGTTDINTLKSIVTTGTTTYLPTATTDVLRLGAAGGVLNTSGGSALLLGDVANNGILTAGGADNTAGSISFWSNSTLGGIAVNMAITDNGTGATTLNKAGNGTLTLNGTNTYSGGTSIGAGVLNLGTGSSLGNPNGTLTLTGGALNLNGNNLGVGILTGFGGTIRSDVAGAATLTIGNNDASSTAPYRGTIVNGTGPVSLVKAGTGTLILAGNNTYTGTTTITGTLQIGADTGTGTLGTGAVTVNAASTLAFNRADAAYTVANAISGAGGVSFRGRGTITLTAANSYTGPTTISAGTLALSGGNNRLPSGTTLAFSNTVPFASWINLGSTNQTLATMTFPNVGMSSTVTGTGTLTINGATDLNIGQTNAAAANLTTVLDLGGLGNFVVNSPANVFRVGIASNGGSFSASATNINSVVTLAANTTITAATLGIQDVGLSGNAGNAILLLGTTNTINVNAVNAGFSNRSGGTFAFAPGLTGATAVFRNTNGTSPVNTFNIGQNANNSAGAVFTFATDFTGGSVDLLVNSMIVGQADTFANTGRAGSLNASFAFGAGTVAVVNTLSLGIIANTGGTGTVSAAGPYTANGTFTVNGPGTLTVPAIILATNTITETQNTTNKIVSGTLNLLGGTITATNILVGAQTGNATSVTAAFNWAGGTLQNTAGANLFVAGNGSVNLAVTLSSPAAKTLAPSAGQSITFAGTAPIGGPGGLVVNGPGTVVLAAANTYTGGTTLNQGTLTVGGSLAAGTVTLNAGTLNGTGTVAGPVTVNPGATLRADTGSGTGTLNLGTTGVVRGATLFANLGAPGTSSQLALGAGTLSLFSGSTLAIKDVSGFAVGNYGTYTIATTTGGTLNLNASPAADGFVFGAFVQGTGNTGPVLIDTAGLASTPLVGDMFTLSRAGNNLVLNYAVVPEPVAALGLAALGLGLAGRMRRRRRG